MSRWPRLLAVLILVAASWPVSAQQPTIAPAPIPGPVGLSVGNEARMALLRAERWLQHHAPDAPDAPLSPPDEDGFTRLLPLLQGEFIADTDQENRYEAIHCLALGLAGRGEPVVFLPDGTSILWRNTLLHDLASTQHPDDRGGGYWTTLPEPTPGDTLRSTVAARAALLFLLGEPAP